VSIYLERKLIKNEITYIFSNLRIIMRLTVYWGNIFISVCVCSVAWFTTSVSTLESLGIAVTAFISANILENVIQFTGISKKPRHIELVNHKKSI
jgi:sensor histidine kinase YesM